MNISGIHPYSGIYDYNSIKSNAIATQPVQSVPAVQEVAQQEQQSSNISADAGSSGGQQTFGVFDFAQQYQSDTTFQLKGADSDVRDLDMNQAISDMQKDQVLQQYQFFVGESQAQTTEADAMSLRASENFTF